MITLSPIDISSTECTGITFIDTTNYNQLPSGTIGGFLNIFALSNFEAGVRLINVVDPQGNSYTFFTTAFVNLIPFNPPIYITDTSITASNNTNYSQLFQSITQGQFTVRIVSIPAVLNVSDNSTRTNAQIGDLCCFYFVPGVNPLIFQALVNNPTQDIYDNTQWKNQLLTNGFRLQTSSPYVFGSTPTFEPFPSNYLNQVTYSQDCYLSNLECVFNNIDCAFCCDCCDGDIFKNQNAVRAIKASLLVLELQLTINQLTSEQIAGERFTYTNGLDKTNPLYLQQVTPNDSYLNKVCKYSKAISSLCNCNPLPPCQPCDTTSASATLQLVTPQEITNAIITILGNNFVQNLNKQVMLGKPVSNVNRKQFLAFLITQVASGAAISLSAPNYNCLNSIIDLTNSYSSLPYLIARDSSVIVNDQGSVISYNGG